MPNIGTVPHRIPTALPGGTAATATIAAVAVIPFYGVEHPDLFAIERRAMDRPGRVIEALAARFPERGKIVDVGAGDGFTAARLSSSCRTVYPVEPARGMMRADRDLEWIQTGGDRC